jgi:uncharacterized repeat protein (TIGR01451 family)
MRPTSRRRRLTAVLAVAALALLVGLGAASATPPPGVDPPSVTATLNPGDHITVTKTVHTLPIPPEPDVYFLADSTGSMGPAIANVRTNAGAIMSDVASNSTNPMFGAGDYKDFQRPQLDPYVFNNGASIGSSATALAAINAWTAPSGSGHDGPEGQLFALHQLATNPAIGFRSGSTRVVVWFGDAPGHDPVCTGFTGLASDITTSSVAAELAAAHIRVIAISLTTGDYPVGGLNADQLANGFEHDYDAVCGTPSSVSNEATTITAATGGQLFTVNDPSQISNAILAGLHNLPVTVAPSPTCDPGLTATYDAASKNATSGDDVTFTETLTVDPSNPGGTTLHCTVDFLQNGLLASPAFQQSVAITVNGADLAVTKTGPSLVTEGHNLTYHLTATNNGPANATGVAVTDTLPSNSTFVSASAGCTPSAGVVTCAVGSLAAGASVSFDITVTAGSTGSTLVNTATIHGNQSDPVSGNNTATVTTALNHNPVCSGATGGPNLWPPNHKLRLVTISGVTDPDGNPVTTTVTGVTQDEPLNGLGDGDTSPDALPALGSNQVWLRAERSGTGDGRVYRVGIQATDGLGGVCTGVVDVGVPHDQGAHSTPVDSGGVFVDF